MNTKILLTSIAALAISVPAIADPVTPNIAVGTNPADCNETVLETTSGTSNLQAEWTPNTLNLKWYDDVNGTEITPDNNAATTCTYDSGITVPSNTLTKTGYTFAGWQVKASGFNLSSLFGPNSNSICDYGTVSGFAGKSGTYKSDTDKYGLTEGSGQWAVALSYGKIKGESRCSSQHPSTFWYNNNYTFTSDHFATNLTDETYPNGEGQYCWCKPTLYAESNSNSYQTVAASSWVFYYDVGSASGCADSCASFCASGVRDGAAFRGALFGVGGADMCH